MLGLILLLALSACGDDSSPTDTGTPADSAPSDTAVADTATDAPPGLGDLRVEWTVDGGSEMQSTRCDTYGIGAWTVNLTGAATVAGPGIDCAGGVWAAMFDDIESGTYTVTVTARAGVCCTGAELASREQMVLVSTGGGTPAATFDFTAADF